MTIDNLTSIHLQWKVQYLHPIDETHCVAGVTVSTPGFWYGVQYLPYYMKRGIGDRMERIGTEMYTTFMDAEAVCERHAKDIKESNELMKGRCLTTLDNYLVLNKHGFPISKYSGDGPMATRQDAERIRDRFDRAAPANAPHVIYVREGAIAMLVGPQSIGRE